MRYLIAIMVVIVLVGVLLVALINLTDYGASGFVLAGLSAFTLFKIFKLMFDGYGPYDDYNGVLPDERPADSRDPLYYIIFDNSAGDSESAAWDDR